MSATIARQGVKVSLEQYAMRLAMNIAKMAKGGFLCAAIEETQYLIKKLCAEVREDIEWDFESPGHQKVKAGIERHTDMLRQNHTVRCLTSQNGAANIRLTGWRRKGTGATQPNRC